MIYQHFGSQIPLGSAPLYLFSILAFSVDAISIRYPFWAENPYVRNRILIATRVQVSETLSST
jgi:hypothetical protein